MTTTEERAERLARIRARRGTAEREAAVDQVRSARDTIKADPIRPEGEMVDGYAHQLRPGDWVVTMGGPGARERRRRVEDVVMLAGRTPRQRTRGTVIFARCGEWTMGTWYPVTYIRPAPGTVTEYDIDA